MSARRAASVDIQKAREEKRMTRTILASKTGLSPGYIKVVEKRKARPSPDSLKKIASALSLNFEKTFKEYRPNEPIPSPDEITPRKRRKKKAEEDAVTAISDGRIAIIETKMVKDSLKSSRAAANVGQLQVFEGFLRQAHDDALRAVFAHQAGADRSSTWKLIRGAITHIADAIKAATDLEHSSS
jgi:transcriptional regulator with XRE-family HTH domain